MRARRCRWLLLWVIPAVVGACVEPGGSQCQAGDERCATSLDNVDGWEAGGELAGGGADGDGTGDDAGDDTAGDDTGNDETGGADPGDDTGGGDDGAGGGDAGGDDAGGGDAGGGDAGGDDGGAPARQCRFPDQGEVGDPNEGLNCAFFASGPDVVYLIDPYRQTVEPIASYAGGIAIFDIEMDLEGQLVGLVGSSLLALNDDGSTQNLGDTGITGNVNGLAIFGDGTLFATSSESAWRRRPGEAVASPFGNLSSKPSSGDCLVAKGRLWMSAIVPPTLQELLGGSFASLGDMFVQIDIVTGAVADIGRIGFADVWGLAEVGDDVFGVTSEGDVISIDVETGAGSRVFSTPHAFYGAANNRFRE
jgi:hypothetical protein